ncbi:hypothetical protein SCLCIDRAFT_1216479 [Scleroderma citrinum Foug A]|uniref:SH3 domain-containing protein n=1 Tax=Scleroderma citrinum Foug A TaxID=1036808 RepID=A0A0C3A7F0_9AGAM|nr:hypothetical protein SCLCIDRAFT_1216479 [Scleroderma citrinum Foug A]
MVFTRLSAQEKEAFFGLLDEYFQSRPELLNATANGNAGGAAAAPGIHISPATAASAVQRALAATSGPTPSPGHNNNNNTSTGARNVQGMLGRNNPFGPAASSAASNPEVGHAAGRVAAAALAFSSGNAAGKTTEGGVATTSPGPTPKLPPPGVPRRIPSFTSTAPQEPSSGSTPGSEIDKLISKKNSVFSSFKKNTVPQTPLPPTFSAPKGTFGPPPVRRVPSTSETSDKSSSPVPPAPPGRRVPVVRQPEPEPEPESEQQGEWVEVLYDYSSEDPGDLNIEAGSRILVTERSSEDWWTGKIEGQGREGLFPASYVKLL